MDQKIFKELSLTQSNVAYESDQESQHSNRQSGKSSTLAYNNHKFSLSEIVARNKISKSLDISQSAANATASRFSVRKPNKYSSDFNSSKRTVEVKVLDLIY